MRYRTFFTGLAAGLALSIGGAVWAVADGNPATDQVPRVVPYDGVLEQDGTAVHGAAAMRFSLHAWDDVTGAATGGALWTEEWSSLASKSCTADCPVHVRAGRFMVQLGKHVNIMPTVQAADDVCLSIAVHNGSDWTPLGGCQRITPAPTALWSASASALAVAGDVNAGGNVTAGGTVTAQRVVVNQGISKDSTATSADLGLYSGTTSAAMRYVTTGGPHYFFVDGGNNPNGVYASFYVQSSGHTVAQQGFTAHGGATLHGGVNVGGNVSASGHTIAHRLYTHDVTGHNAWYTSPSIYGQAPNFTHTCPRGSVMIGIQGITAGYMGHARILCATLGSWR